MNATSRSKRITDPFKPLPSELLARMSERCKCGGNYSVDVDTEKGIYRCECGGLLSPARAMERLIRRVADLEADVERLRKDLNE